MNIKIQGTKNTRLWITFIMTICLGFIVTNSVHETQTVSAQAVLHQGTSNGVTWEIFDDGLLQFRPTNGVRGTMSNLTEYTSTRPWYAYRDLVTHVNFKDGVEAGTSLAYMFGNMSNIKTINFGSFDTSNVTTMEGMFSNASSLTTLDLSNFDTSNVTNMRSMFSYMSSLTTLDVSSFDTSNVTDMAGMFFGVSSLTTLDVSNFDTSKVTNMSSMFDGARSLTTLDVSNFDTRNVTNMYAMFYGASSLTTLDVSNFDTRNVTNMRRMFSGMSSLTTLDVSNFDTRNVTNMSSMFYGASSLTTLDVSNFDTRNVTNMSYMFYGASSLTTLDVSNFDTRNVTNMYAMFYGASSLTTLDVSNFDTRNVTNMSYMFYGARSLTTLDVSNFDTSKVKNMNSMFRFASSLTTLDLSNFDTRNVTDMRYMFASLPKLTSINLSPNFEFKTGHSFATTPSGISPEGTEYTGKWVHTEGKAHASTPGKYEYTAEELSTVYDGTISGLWVAETTKPPLHQGVLNGVIWEIFDDGLLQFRPRNGVHGVMSNLLISNSSRPWYAYRDLVTHVNFKDGVEAGTSLAYMFGNMSNIKTINFGSFDTSNVTTMEGMFSNASSLTTLDLSNFDTSNVTNMRSMFSYMSSLTTLDVSSFDTSNVTNMSSMFYGARRLTTLDLSNFDTSKVTNMSSMFDGARSLTTLDVSNFDTRNVTDMRYMFSGMSSLTTLDVSNFDTSKVTNMSSMFYEASKLTTLDLRNFDTRNVTDMRTMFYNASNLTTLDLSNFNTSKVTTMEGMFFNASRLTTLDVSNFDTSKVTNMSIMFTNASSLTTLDVSNFDTSKVTNMRDMFSDASSLTTLDLSNFDTSKVTNMSSMFSNSSSLTTLDLSNFDTSNVTNMSYMFSEISSLTTLDLSNFDTSNVRDMYMMFSNASSLTTLDVSNFDTRNVTDMRYMFASLPKLTSINLSPNFEFKTGHSFTTTPNGISPEGKEYTGKWVHTEGKAHASTPGKYEYTAEELSTVYDGTISGLWVADEINIEVIFDSQGGTEVKSKEYSRGSELGSLPVTTRVGYEFVGWYTAKEGGTKIHETTKVTNNVTYYAQWLIRPWEESDFLYGEGSTAIIGLSESGYVKKDAGIPLVFPNLPNVVKISNRAFEGEGFKGTINLDGLTNLVEIGVGAFKSNEFTGSLNLSKLTKLDRLGDEAFVFNKFTGSLTFGSTSNITTIGSRVFSGKDSSGLNNKFTGELDLSGLTKLVSIGSESFINNNFTGALKFGASTGLTSIGDSAFEANNFSGALNLSTLTGLESIGKRAFYGNKFSGSLNITPLDKLHTIGQDAFSTIEGNSKISSVTDTAPTGKKRIWVTTKGNYNTEVTLDYIAARPSVPVYAEWFNLVWEADDFTYTNDTTRTVITGLSVRGNKKRELGLKGLVFPNIPTVTSIADNAFSGKEFEGTLDLRQMKNLDTIGVEAFANNKFTGDLNFTGLSKLNTIKNGAFNNAYNTSSTIGTLTIKSLTSLTTIEANAFTGNKFTGGLDLTGNTNLVTIGANAFKGVIHNPSNTAAPINISGLAKLQTIGAGAFSDNNSQSTLSLSGLTSLVTIGEGAFRNANITGSLSLNELTNLVEIQDNAFRGNKFTGNLTFGSISKLTRIGADAFNDGTPTGSTGFTGIIDVRNVVSLNEIGANAFYGHNQVTDFIDYIKEGKQRSWFTQPNGAGNRVEQADIPNGPSNTIYVQLEDLAWEIPDFTYADSGKTITGLSSRGVQKLEAGLKGLTFPHNNNVTAIANNAFNGSKYKFSGTLNFNGMPNVQTIGDNAFTNAQFTGNLTLNALQELTKIGNGAFHNNQFTGGLNLNLPNLTTIGDNAFSNNQLNGSLSLGGVPNLQTIGSSAFRHNKFSGTLDLKALVKIDSVGAYAFANNTGFTTVVNPEVPRYRFQGWFTGRNGTGAKQDIRTNTNTVYPHQVAIVYYHLTLMNNMTGEEIGKIEYEENTEIDLENDPNIPIPELEGYRFVGWQSDDDFGTTRTKIVLDKDKTITTKWVPVGHYVIKFVVNGGIEISDIEVPKNTTIVAKDLEDLTERHGFILEGWYLDEELTKKVFNEFTPDRDITLYAKWIPRDTNIVKFDSMGGSAVPDMSVLSGYQIGDLPVPKRQGYIFLGWYLNKNYTTEITSTYIPTSKETTLYANWTAKEDVVRVTFDSQGGTDNYLYVRERGTSLGTLPRPIRDGLYNFEGWYTQKDGKGTKINSNTIANNDITYYAKWVEVKVNEEGKDYEDKDNLYNPGAVPKPPVTVEDINKRIDEFNQDEDSEPVSRVTTIDNIASSHWRVGNSIQDTLIIEDDTDPSNPRKSLYGDEGFE